MDSLPLWCSIIVIAAGLVVLFLRARTGQEIDRRLLFLFLAIAVAVPVLFPVAFPEKATPVVQTLFDAVESLPEGAPVLVSFDFDPAMAPECQPMADALIRHILIKRARPVMMTLWPAGSPQIQQTVTTVVETEFPDRSEGNDYAILGYKAGEEGTLRALATAFKKIYPTDAAGRPTDSLPITRTIRSAADFQLILSFGGGKPGAIDWLLFVADPRDIPLGAGVAAVSAPQLYPYYPRQMLGILGGIKGAAEYEAALLERYPEQEGMPTPGLVRMGPQTVAHLVIMGLILIGNIVHFRSKRARTA